MFIFPWLPGCRSIIVTYNSLAETHDTSCWIRDLKAYWSRRNTIFSMLFVILDSESLMKVNKWNCIFGLIHKLKVYENLLTSVVRGLMMSNLAIDYFMIMWAICKICGLPFNFAEMTIRYKKLYISLCNLKYQLYIFNYNSLAENPWLK